MASIWLSLCCLFVTYNEKEIIEHDPGSFQLWLTNPGSMKGVVHECFIDIHNVGIHHNEGNTDPLQTKYKILNILSYILRFFER